MPREWGEILWWLFDTNERLISRALQVFRQFADDLEPVMVFWRKRVIGRLVGVKRKKGQLTLSTPRGRWTVSLWQEEKESAEKPGRRLRKKRPKKEKKGPSIEDLAALARKRAVIVAVGSEVPDVPLALERATVSLPKEEVAFLAQINLREKLLSFEGADGFFTVRLDEQSKVRLGKIPIEPDELAARFNPTEQELFARLKMQEEDGVLTLQSLTLSEEPRSLPQRGEGILHKLFPLTQKVKEVSPKKLEGFAPWQYTRLMELAPLTRQAFGRPDELAKLASPILVAISGTLWQMIKRYLTSKARGERTSLPEPRDRAARKQRYKDGWQALLSAATATAISEAMAMVRTDSLSPYPLAVSAKSDCAMFYWIPEGKGDGPLTKLFRPRLGELFFVFTALAEDAAKGEFAWPRLKEWDPDFAKSLRVCEGYKVEEAERLKGRAGAICLPVVTTPEIHSLFVSEQDWDRVWVGRRMSQETFLRAADKQRKRYLAGAQGYSFRVPKLISPHRGRIDLRVPMEVAMEPCREAQSVLILCPNILGDWRGLLAGLDGEVKRELSYNTVDCILAHLDAADALRFDQQRKRWRVRKGWQKRLTALLVRGLIKPLIHLAERELPVVAIVGLDQGWLITTHKAWNRISHICCFGKVEALLGGRLRHIGLPPITRLHLFPLLRHCPRCGGGEKPKEEGGKPKGKGKEEKRLTSFNLFDDVFSCEACGLNTTATAVALENGLRWVVASRRKRS